MITSPQSRIDEYTEKGWWGHETLHSLLAKAVDEFPERLAVADQPNRNALTGQDARRIDYQTLAIESDRIAQQLLAYGVKTDDKLIVQLPNIVELVITYYAASKIGAILSPVPIQYGKHELTNIAATLNTKWFITTQTFRDYDLAKNAEQLGFDVLCYYGPKEASYRILDATQTSNLDALRRLQSTQGEELDNANRIITICWTSGTTGTPKGVPRSHNMWLATTAAEVDACDYRPGDRLLNPFPLINMAAIGGFLYPSILMAGTLYLHHPLDPQIYLLQLQDEGINFTIAPPPLLNQLAKSQATWQQFDFSALRRIGSGSAPLAPWMVETFSQDYGVEVINFYGSNEGICLLSTTETSPLPEQRAIYFPRLGSPNVPWRGAVYEFAKTKVVDTETNEEITQPGRAGELLIAGPTIFDGYFERSFSLSHSECFDENGFFHTGDMVEICGDPALYYQIVGRCKDIINRGGMKISPIEIDALLAAHPAVKEVAVCAYDDERLGERICACVVPENAANVPSLEALCEHLAQAGLAKYKMPERLETLTVLPRNPMGKVQRFELAELVARESHV